MKRRPLCISWCEAVIYLRRIADEEAAVCRTEIVTAMALSAILCGSGAFMGADFRFFFAQTGGAAGWGIAFAAAMSGLCIAAHGASASLQGRLSGARGRWLRLGLRACLAGNILLALRDAARVGEMALPFARAAGIAALAALVLATLLACRGWRALRACLAGLTVCIALWAAALLCFDRLPSVVKSMGGCALRLECIPAAIALAAVRCAAGLAPCTVLLAQMPASSRSSIRRGAAVAVMWAGQLMLMDAALKRQPENLLLLAQPFAAMACAWGRGGYYAVCALTALAAIFALALSLAALASLAGDKTDVKSWLLPRH